MSQPQAQSEILVKHLVLAVVLLILCPHTDDNASVAQVLADAIRNRVEAGSAAGRITAGGSTMYARTALPEFYRRRGYEPAWNDARLKELVAALRTAESHGLRSSDYRVDRLDRGVLDIEVELLATDAFLLFGSHLLHGRVNPERFEAEWTANRRRTDMAEILENAVRTSRIQGVLDSLAPQQERYDRLRSQLATLLALEGEEWHHVPGGPKLEIGMTDDRVALCRTRLAALGDLAADSGSRQFDDGLKDAVVRFQSRHGLEADGVIGPATLAALNRSPAERINQIKVNLERWRWLPADLGRHHIEVNIAGFDVTVRRDGEVTRLHRAVVGRTYRQTPMFTGNMTYLVLAPYWHVPPTIAVRDKLPAIKRNPGYLAAQKMTLFDQKTNAVVDPKTVDWSTISGRDFNARYRLRQDPGPLNALGHVKFMFPNRHNVYLHDTPTRELFSKAARDFSSGCVRVEHPLDLAEYLLAPDPSWNRERIERVVAGGKELSVRLIEPLPVHLLYWTTWVGDDGLVNQRNDLYGRDPKVLDALTEAPVSK